MAKETDIRHRFLADPKIANKFMDEVEDRLVALEAGGGLPEVTASDNGDVLAVVEGVWNKATPGKELPEVTASDNGDVLAVVEGVWGKATPSGGGNVAIIEGVLASGTVTTSYSDITNALSAGKLPLLKIGTGENTVFLVYASRYIDDSEGIYLFTGFQNQSGSIKLNMANVYPSGTVTTTQKTIG